MTVTVTFVGTALQVREEMTDLIYGPHQPAAYPVAPPAAPDTPAGVEAPEMCAHTEGVAAIPIAPLVPAAKRTRGPNKPKTPAADTTAATPPSLPSLLPADEPTAAGDKPVHPYEEVHAQLLAVKKAYDANGGDGMVVIYPLLQKFNVRLVKDLKVSDYDAAYDDATALLANASTLQNKDAE